MDMDRSKRRIFEILIFIDSLLVIPSNVSFLKSFPVEEDQTEQKIFIINLKQFLDRNHFKCDFFLKKMTSPSKLNEVKNLIFEISDHH